MHWPSFIAGLMAGSVIWNIGYYYLKVGRHDD
jgi:hypothetical protein